MLHPQTEPTVLLSIDDVLARFIPVSRPTLTKLIKSGQLESVRIGRRVFFRGDAIEEFVRSCGKRGEVAVG